MIERNISHNLLKFIIKKEKHKNVLIIDGVRQVGKTTAIQGALKESGQNFLEINLEKQKVLRNAIDQTKEFGEFERLLLQQHGFIPGQNKILFVDEANESFKLGHYVRQMKEDWENQTVILTGSMMQRLFRDKDIRIPVGRFENMTVWPFSFAEFLKANEQTASQLTKYGLLELIHKPETLSSINPQEHATLLTLLDHYLTCGGIPEIALNYLDSSGQASISKSILQYLENLREDFLKIFSQEYSNLFDRAMGSVANLLGQPYKKTALIQKNDRLAENILAIFEHWKLILKIDQKAPRTTSSNSLHPKRYLFDVGVARCKRESGIPSIDIAKTLHFAQREPLGGLMEQLLCVELKKLFPDLSGFRDKNYEIDFLVKIKNEMVPIECKASLKTNKNQYRGLDLYHQTYQNKKAVVVSLAPYSVLHRSEYTLYHIPLYAVSCLTELI